METFMDPEDIEEIDVPQEDAEPEVETSEADEEEQEVDQVDGEDEGGEQLADGEESEPEGLVISFDGEDDEGEKQEAPQWAKDLRKQYQELKKENRKLKAEREAAQAAEKEIELGEKPTLEGHNYDEDAYTLALGAWFERSREVEAKKAQKAEAEKKEADAWQEKLYEYEQAKSRVAAQAGDKYAEAEEEVKDSLSPMRQGLILDAVKDPALMVYALGCNPDLLNKFSSIKNDVQFIAELARLETTMKSSGVKRKPQPERRIGGNSGAPISSKTRLERLEAEAAKTGDRTKVQAYKRKLKQESA